MDVDPHEYRLARIDRADRRPVSATPEADEWFEHLVGFPGDDADIAYATSQLELHGLEVQRRAPGGRWRTYRPERTGRIGY